MSSVYTYSHEMSARARDERVLARTAGQPRISSSSVSPRKSSMRYYPLMTATDELIGMPSSCLTVQSDEP